MNKSSFDPRINRWTGEPHQNKQEVERRLKQKVKVSKGGVRD